MVADVNIQSALNQQAKTSNSSAQLADDFSQFLNLLTTQLQNQDPLSPMDTTEFTNQLVAFSGVEQQINTNQKLDSLVALGLSNTMGGALGYVGLNVSYVSADFHYDGTNDAEISYALSDQAVESKIRIYDEEGTLLHEAEASNNSGSHSFTWDGTLDGGGTAAEGTYNVKVDALDIDGNAIDTTTVVTGRVRGVETQNGSIFVLVGERAVSVANVINASQPPTTETTEQPET